MPSSDKIQTLQPTQAPLRSNWLMLALFGLLFLSASAKADEISLELPKTGLTAEELGVVVNDDEPMSVKIAEYYRERRGIPKQNILHVRFPPNQANLPHDTFNRIRKLVLEQSGPDIQAYALAWTLPYRVDCMSITSAFAFGFDKAYCSDTQCAATKASAYFNSSSHAPYSDLGIRPAMLLAGNSLSAVKSLIDRGIASDHSYPDRTGYLVKTHDGMRSVRAAFFDETEKALGLAFHFARIEADSIKDKTDVLFYFTGSIWVDDLPSLRFLPGAIADHLTSAGGVLDGKDQMSSLRWLEAGATGSYGAVTEPCNHVQKFPVPPVVIWHYAVGETLIEAYWKSVAWPGEGVFIGEPLAHPFAPSLGNVSTGLASLKVFSPQTTQVRLEEAESPMGPYQIVSSYPISPGINEIKIRLHGKNLYYRIVF